MAFQPKPYTGADATAAAEAAIAAVKAQASGLASLNAGSLVVQNPANADASATASKIPIRDANGDLPVPATVASGNYAIGRTQAAGLVSDHAAVAAAHHARYTDGEADARVTAARGAASGVASLNSSTLVVENPASADAAATASKIALRDANGDLAVRSTVAAGDVAVGYSQMASYVAANSGAQPLNLAKVLSLSGKPGGYSSASYSHWWDTSNATCVLVAPNQVDFTISDVGPDAGENALYSDADDSTRVFLVIFRKNSSDGQTTMACRQVAGSSYPATGGTDSLTLVSGTGDASIAYTGVTTFGPLNLDCKSCGRLVVTATGDGGYAYMRLWHGVDPVTAGDTISAIAHMCVESGDEATLGLYDGTGASIDSATAITATTWAQCDKASGVAVGNYTDLRITPTTSGDVAYIDMVQLVNGDTLPSEYRDRAVAAVYKPSHSASYVYYATGRTDSTISVDFSSYVSKNTTAIVVAFFASETGISGSAVSFSNYYTASAASVAAYPIVAGLYNAVSSILPLPESKAIDFVIAEGDSDSDIAAYTKAMGYYCWEGTI